MINIAQEQIPTLILVVLAATLLTLIPGGIVGFHFAGLAWVIPCAYSLFIIVQRFGKISFPWVLWLPWVIVVFLNLTVAYFEDLDPRVSPVQRSMQLITPILIGMAVSTYPISTEVIKQIVDKFSKFIMVFFVGILIHSFSYIVAGTPSFLAGQVMIAMLFAIFFYVRYALFFVKKDLTKYLLMMILPILTISRTVAAVIFILPIISISRISINRRFIYAVVFMMLGSYMFYLPQIQNKMFFSGHGEISELSLENPDLNTSGRLWLWRIILDRSDDSPWLGHGTGACESLVYSVSSVGYPHNDWILTYYDFGFVGIIIFVIVWLRLLISLMKCSKVAKTSETRFLFLASACTVVPLFIVMLTDNIMSYSAFYGDLQFLIIGMAYAALKHEKSIPMSSELKRR